MLWTSSGRLFQWRGAAMWKDQYPLLFSSIDALVVYTSGHQNIVVLIVGLLKARIEYSLGHHPLMP